MKPACELPAVFFSLWTQDAFMPGVDSLIKKIKQREQQRQTVAETLRTIGTDEPILDTTDTYEKTLLHTVEPATLDMTTITGVDGGLFQKAYHGVDIIATRAIAAMFTVTAGEVESVTYHPEKRPALSYADLGAPLDTQAFKRKGTLMRLQHEIQRCNETIEQSDLLLLDGSIVPQYMDKPSRESPAYDQYTDLLDQYRKLLTTTDTDHQLAGVVEDSRSTNMTERLAEQPRFDSDAATLLRQSPDTTILAYAMEQGERTAVIPYANQTNDHPILGDLTIRDDLYSFYLKTVENDRPVRIDFIADNPIEQADNIAAQILPLCSYSSTYGIPSVVVEADQRAKIDDHDIQDFESRFNAELGPLSGVQDLRRNNRPF